MISLLALYVMRLSLLSTANGTNMCGTSNMCGTRNPTKDEISDAHEVAKLWNESVGQTTTGNQKITIDTVWHRITSGDQGNSEDDVTNSMVVLNNAFAPHFKFNLIKNTVSDQPYYWDPPFGDGAMRMHLHEGDCNVLNIYSTKISVSGIAEFPSRCAYNNRMDGVIISYDTVPGGADSKWNKGYTLVHEVGHWMNLFHTFEGGCFGLGDGIMDTPASRLNRGCPQGKDSCSSEGIDLINNFMDYTDDSCRISFTSGQFTAMKAAWYKHRYSGPTRPTILPTNTPSVIGATNEPTMVYTGKQFTSHDELKVQAKAYCATPDTYDTSVYGAIEDWDVSQITSMRDIFYRLKCNPDVGKWDVSRVETFKNMFQWSKFNKDISRWDVSKGTDFTYMLASSHFNQDISRWDVSNGINFTGMFSGSGFNHDIGAWDVSTGVYFAYMFRYNSQFNQDISRWDVRNGLYFFYMFQLTDSFNQNISTWNLAGGIIFKEIFKDAKAFNQNLNPWLKWLTKSNVDSTEWCLRATCDANTALFPTTTPSVLPSMTISPTVNKCAGLDEENCVREGGICKYSKQKKIMGDCQYKKKIYNHDCTQYISNESCLSGFYPGMCMWKENVCLHVCKGLSKESCKSKEYFFNKICKMPKIKNPCLGCQLKSKC